ncbi:hypothetical protein MtrunA17_Chr0c01g0489211 [Medicago truncatula]|uniref:Uncharacterized protein n=1 Tax=Medicago truncatula TaxID=3880 RepID=A0A396G9E3_MEDTR|nr:hypothetical protein MtrunA17_Chr0c01g0489211 [Medicago truncatula]
MACPKTRTLTAMVLYQVIRIESFKAANVGERQDYMLIRMYMPGRIKEDVYQNTLSIKGERGGRKSSSRLDLTGKHYKIY